MDSNTGNSGNGINNSKVLDVYGVIRDYITHEDSLINNRLTWLLTIQGLLFTAYGLSVREATKSADLVSLIFILKILGIATSFLGFTGIFAAALAIKAVEEKWKSLKNEDLYKNDSLIKSLPDVTGGGNIYVHMLGAVTPLAIPSIFFVVWFSLLDLWQYAQIIYAWLISNPGILIAILILFLFFVAKYLYNIYHKYLRR